MTYKHRARKVRRQRRAWQRHSLDLFGRAESLIPPVFDVSCILKISQSYGGVSDDALQFLARAKSNPRVGCAVGRPKT